MISVGVDIGTYSIKIAEVEATSKSYAIRRVQEYPLSMDPTRDRKIETIDILRTVFGQYDVSNTQFVFSIPERFISSRLLHFPFRERFKIQKAMAIQLEDEMPLTQEEAVFDAKIARFVGKGADVLAVAVLKEKLHDVLSLAHDCGVEPMVISANGMGLNNLFESWMDPPKENPAAVQEIPAPRNADLVLNIGHSSTEILVHAEGALIAVRDLDWGAKNIAEAIGQKYGLNNVQAMRELQAKGFVILDKSQASKEQQAFSQVIESSLQTLVSNLRMKMLELQSEFNLQWTKGLMVGGGSQLKNMGAFLTQNFQIAFNRYKQFENHPIVPFDVSAQLELVSGTAIGLAIEGLKRPRNPAVNFLKGEMAKQSQAFTAIWNQWGHTIQIAAAAFVAFFIYAVIRDSLAMSLLDASDRALRTQAEAVAGIKGRQATASRIQRFITSQEKLERNRKQAESVKRLNSALDVLDLVNASLPPKQNVVLEIKRFSVDNDSAEIHGYTGSTRERDLINKSLARAARGGKVEPITSRIQTPAGKVGFAFRFNVQRMAGG